MPMNEPDVRRTWLVECYGPGLGSATVSDAGDRVRTAIEIVGRGPLRVEYLGALLVPGDEAVFHAFAADSPEAVEAASQRAGLRYTRIVESVAIAAPGLADALTRLLDSTRPAREARS